MTDQTTENILDLLDAFIHDEKPGLQADPDWNAVFECAKKHSVTGIIGYICTRYNLCDNPQEASVMESAMTSCYGMQYRRAEQMKRLIRLLNENSIDHVLMKGYITKDIYPVPELRSYGDIDFLIRKEDRLKTDELMKQHGYICKYDWEPVYSYRQDTEFYEIHTELLDSEISEGKQVEYFRDVWDHIRLTNDHTYVMDNEYHIIYLLSHLAKHAARRGAGLRMYLDIALYFERYRDTADWEYIRDQLEVLGLKRFFYTVCDACERWFRVSAPCTYTPVSDETFELFTAITVTGGTFGFYGSDPALTALKEVKTEYSRFDKFKIIIGQLFPGADQIEARYTYLQKRRWLLPIAWIDRIFRNRTQILGRVDTARRIVSADKAEVVKLRDLNKEIGL